MPRPQFRKPPKWTDLAPIPPILLVIVTGFIVWTLKDMGSLMPKGTSELKLIGIFVAIVVFGYVFARAGYMYMQKAATITRRKVWAVIMCAGLLTLLGALGVQYLRPEFGLPSLTACALMVMLIALFEGRNVRPSMFIAKGLNMLEDVTGLDLDGFDDDREAFAPTEVHQQGRSIGSFGFLSPDMDDRVPVRRSIHGSEDD